MSKPKLPPPLNAHQDYTIEVNAQQISIKDNPSLSSPVFFVKINVSVSFLSNSQCCSLTGLSAWQDFEVPVHEIVSHDGIPTPSSKSVVADMISSMYIPFQLRQVGWRAVHSDGETIKSDSPFLDEEDIVESLVEFMFEMSEADYNKRKKAIALQVTIEKVVNPPEQEIEEWLAWYNEQKEADEDFERGYNELISKAPALRLLEEVRLVADNSDVFDDQEDELCSICYEEMLPTASQVNRMPCSHCFHKDCILKWLKKNLNCPLCRLSLPIDN